MVLAVIISFLMLINLPLLIIVADDDKPPPPTDLNSDKEALLTFSNALPRVGTKLDWKPDDDDICKWVGITCTNEKPKMGRNGKPVLVDKSEERVVGISLPAVGLYGPIAANSIGKLDALETLSLRSNLLYGNIPPDILSIPTLQSIYLQNNSFCGDIPLFKKFPPKLRVVDLSFNSFTGNIPPVLAKTEELMILALQFNSFSGYVPDLDLKKIKTLNLSYNKLDGPIPPSLQKLPVESFMGNARLCGKPLDDCSALSPAYPPLSTAPYSNKLGAVALALSSSIIILLFLLV